MRSFLNIAIACFSVSAFAQSQSIDRDWFNADVVQDKVAGISVTRSYESLLQGRTPKPVIVAVIDSGVEIDHEDLRDVIWVNVDEIPGNGIDDDNNGYIDDVNGWSFIGGAEGDVEHDNLEFTRVYKSYYDRFSKKSASEITSDEKKDYARYLELEKQYQKRVDDAKNEYEEIAQIRDFYYLCKSFFSQVYGDVELTKEMVDAFEPTDDMTTAMQQFMQYAIENDFGSMLEEYVKDAEGNVLYSYNLNFDSRKIVGDNPNDMNERYYGNANVYGPSAGHGTHVAGIIGAVRNNGLGINGVAAPVVIMPIRAVPQGDERDKDVANAIRYAVDNGAKVINMSFGKSYSPNKTTVDAAVKYAESKGVLMVHAAGNSSRNNDKSNNFPNPVDEVTRELCTTWIEVGASGTDVNALAATFTNYGKRSVDVFAPGVDILSTYPGGEYKSQSGTSMAAPVVSGMAAMIWAYYPALSAKDVREIIVNSYTDYGKKKTPLPQSGGKKEKMVKFKKLSRTGGVVNVYNAIKMAETYSQTKAAGISE